MRSRLFLALILSFVLFVSPTFAIGNSGFRFGNPPEITANAERNGTKVDISGSISDENVTTVIVTVDFEGSLASFPVTIENGEFSLSVTVPIYIEEVEILATDDEQLEDFVVLTF